MSAYDQTKGELCEKCGWAMKFPQEPCRCELERENAALADALASAEIGLKHALMMEPGDPFKRVKAITAALDSVRAARKKAQLIRADHNGDINEMIQKGKEAQP